MAKAQTITESLANVNDSAGNCSASVSASMGVLIGDANSSRRVDSGDLLAVRQQSLQPLQESNFRTDVNASGRIDSGDVLVTRRQNLTEVP